MTPPTVPEEIRQQVREVVFAANDMGLLTSEKCASAEQRQVDILLTLIATALAEAERRGIEMCIASVNEQATVAWRAGKLGVHRKERDSADIRHDAFVDVVKLLRALLPSPKEPTNG